MSEPPEGYRWATAEEVEWWLACAWWPVEGTDQVDLAVPIRSIPKQSDIERRLAEDYRKVLRDLVVPFDGVLLRELVEVAMHQIDPLLIAVVLADEGIAVEQRENWYSAAQRIKHEEDG